MEDMNVGTEETDDNLREPSVIRKLRNRPLVDADSVFSENAWDFMEWNEEQIEEAKQKVNINSSTHVDFNERQKLNEEAALNWNKFYGYHQNKFFKTRTWLFSEFPDLVGPYGNGTNLDNVTSRAEIKKKREHETYPGENSAFRILEVGCGNGSTVFPLLRWNIHPETYVYCCDFSTEAVQIVSENKELDTDRCTPFKWDITNAQGSLPFPVGSIDVISLIFVLSAISPQHFDIVLQNLYRVLKPGGLILFRDYGIHDLVQLRIKPGRCISDNFYFRGDGTLVYFFKEDEVNTIFDRNKFTKLSLMTDRRLHVNRLRKLKMFRIWVQGKFCKGEEDPSNYP